MPYEIKARTLGEILDGAFQLYRNHFGTFLATAAAITLPSLVVVALVNWALTGTLSAIPTPQAGGGLRLGLVYLISAPVWFGSYILQQSILTIAIADAYLGRPVSVGAAFRRTAGLLGSLIGATLLTGFGIAVGFALLVVPGILFMLSWLFTVQAVTVEGCGASASLSRSKKLTAGRRGRLAGLVLLLSIINIAINYAVGAVIPNSVQTLPLIGSLLQQFPAILLAPLYPAVVTLAYFDARVRSEAFDLEVLSRSIGGDAPAAAPIAAPTA